MSKNKNNWMKNIFTPTVAVVSATAMMSGMVTPAANALIPGSVVVTPDATEENGQNFGSTNSELTWVSPTVVKGHPKANITQGDQSAPENYFADTHRDFTIEFLPNDAGQQVGTFLNDTYSGGHDDRGAKWLIYSNNGNVPHYADQDNCATENLEQKVPAVGDVIHCKSPIKGRIHFNEPVWQPIVNFSQLSGGATVEALKDGQFFYRTFHDFRITKIDGTAYNKNNDPRDVKFHLGGYDHRSYAAKSDAGLDILMRDDFPVAPSDASGDFLQSRTAGGGVEGFNGWGTGMGYRIPGWVQDIEFELLPTKVVERDPDKGTFVNTGQQRIDVDHTASDLEVKKTVNEAVAERGQQLEWTVKVRRVGGSANRGYVLKDIIPDYIVPGSVKLKGEPQLVNLPDAKSIDITDDQILIKRVEPNYEIVATEGPNGALQSRITTTSTNQLRNPAVILAGDDVDVYTFVGDIDPQLFANADVNIVNKAVVSGNEVDVNQQNNQSEAVTVVKPIDPTAARTVALQGVPQSSDEKDSPVGALTDAGKTAAEMFPKRNLNGATYALKTAPTANGTYTIDETSGKVTFTPNADFAGNAEPAVVEVTTADGVKATAEYHPVVVPKLEDLAKAGEISQPVTVALDPKNKDIDPATVKLVDPATGDPVTGPLTVDGQGEWSVEPDGSIKFTPAAGFEGNPTPVKYIGNTKDGVNGEKGLSEGTVTVTYAGVKKAATVALQGTPQSSDEKTSPVGTQTDAGKTAAEMFPGHDLNGATYALKNAAADGTVTVAGKGKYSIDEKSGKVTFTPEDNFAGTPDPVEVELTRDGAAQATAEYQPVVVPKLEDISKTGELEQPVTVPLDPKNKDIDPTTVKLVDADGNPVDGPLTTDDGVWSVEADGSIKFTPNDDFKASGKLAPAPVKYIGNTKDGVNGEKGLSEGTVTVKYAGVKKAETVALQGTPQSSDEKTSPVGDKLDAGKTAAEMFPGHDLNGATYTLKDAADDGTVTVAGQGKYSIDEKSGKVTFTPEDNFAGTPTPAGVELTTAAGGVVTAEYQPVVVPKLADLTKTGELEQPVTVELDPKNKDIDPASVKLVDADGNRVETLTVDGEGVWTVNPANGEITFTPSDEFKASGKLTPAPVKYIGDTKDAVTGVVGKSEGTVTVKYAGAKNATTVGLIGVEQKSSDQDAMKFFENTDKEVADQGKLPSEMFPGVEAPTYALATTDAVDAQGNPAGTFKIADNGVVTFTPKVGFAGQVAPVEITATSGGKDYVATYAPLVVPVVENLSAQGTAGKPVTIPVDVTDKGIDPASLKLVDPKTGQPVDGDLVVPGEGTWSVVDGAFKFTPENDTFAGPVTDVKYVATAPDGTKVAAPATIHVDYVAAKHADTIDVKGKVQHSTDADADDHPLLPGEMFAGAVSPVFSLKIGDKTVNANEPLEVTREIAPGVTATATYQVGANGVVTFTPDDKFVGKADVVTVVATTAAGVLEGSYQAIVKPALEDVTVAGEPGQPVELPFDPATGVDPKTLRFGGDSTNPELEKIVPGEGKWSVDPATGTVTFEPEPGFTKAPTPVEYFGESSDGVEAVPGTLTVTVADKPAAGVDSKTFGLINKPQKSSDKHTATDDVPADEGKTPAEMFPVVETLAADKTKEFKLVGADADGKVVIPGQGEYKVDADGVVTFTPEKGFVGVADPATVTLLVKKGDAVVGTYTAMYTPEVVRPKDPFADVDNATAGVDAKTYGDKGANQTSADKDAATGTVPADEGKTPAEMFPGLTGTDKVFKLVGADAEGKVKIPGQGTYTVDADGVVTFDPEDEFVGTPTPVVVLANDSDGVLYKATYTPVVVPVIPSQEKTGEPGEPVTTDDPFKGIPGVDPESIGFVDPKDPTADPKKELKVPGEGVWTITPEGKVTFTPEDGFTKTPTPVNVGGKGEGDIPVKPGTVTITVTDKPAAGEDAKTFGLVDTPQKSSDKDAATANVPADEGKTPEEMFPKLAAIKEAGKKVAFTVSGGNPAQGEYTINGKGVVTFTPEKGFVGTADPATVTLTVSVDGAVTGTYAATYTPEVIPVKDPFADPDTAVAGENAKTYGDKGANQTSADKDAATGTVPADEGKTPAEMFPGLTGTDKVFKLVGADAEGKVKIPGQGTYTVDANGVVTFDPEDEFVGTPTPVEVLANDDNGQLYKATYTPVVVPVIPSQEKTGEPGEPVTTDDPFKDIPGVVPESIGFVDPKDPTADPKKELKVPGEGVWTIDPDGKVTFTPEDGFTKTPTPVNVGGKGE
ncbi:hypothetical protein NXS99_09035, partial [Corynebacterium sp. HS2168-gen11]